MRLSLAAFPVLVLWLCPGSARVVAQDAAGSSALGVDLSPKAAARAAAELPDAVPPKGAAREPSERDLREGVPGLVRMDDATLGQMAAYQVNRMVWRILQFWKRPPESRPVRYFYIGQSVDVAIHDDGSYDVRDKRGLALSVATARNIKEPGSGSTNELVADSTSNPGGSARPVGIGIAIREPERMLQKIVTGREPLNAELRTFLEKSRPLRERLLSREAIRAQQAASVRMNEQLRRIWQVPTPSERKRQETFALWDQCSEDETGALARRHIESFVHELARRRGECPYPAVDLARLNQKRRSKALFSPCDGTARGSVATEAADAGASTPDARAIRDAAADSS